MDDSQTFEQKKEKRQFRLAITIASFEYLPFSAIVSESSGSNFSIDF